MKAIALLSFSFLAMFYFKIFKRSEFKIEFYQ